MIKYLATLRVTFEADDEVEASVIGNEIQEVLAKHVLEDEDTVDVTQILPLTVDDLVTPEEVVAQMRRTRDLLIATRIGQCVDVARELDKWAWLLENRQERTMFLGNYDWQSFNDKVAEIIGRKRG